MLESRSFSGEPFSGPYGPDDCEFLLQVIDIPTLSVEEKERRLQLGNTHYSSMVSTENKPDEAYLTLFKQMVEKYKGRLAREICLLAATVVQKRGVAPTFVSLVRAGTPIGVLLNRAVKHLYQSNADLNPRHYSISIIRDKGIDTDALKYLQDHGIAAESIMFVDGWTAKGVINQELKAAIAQWNSESDYQISDQLCVVADISGNADIFATRDDYVIPSGILNSTVSGLISRTLLHPDYRGWHQCVSYQHLAEYDLSNWFVDAISAEFISLEATEQLLEAAVPQPKRPIADYLTQLRYQYDISDINLIKPGIAEATRVMLRRIPERLIVKDLASPDIVHLIHLAQDKNVPVVVDDTMPFNAVALIKRLKPSSNIT
jgi:hypothetical protein